MSRHIKTRPPTYVLATNLYLRLLGGIYLIAFTSLWVQIQGLIGSNGILPATRWLEHVHERWGGAAYWKAPTLCWLASSDTAMHLWCAAGVLLSLILVIGLAPLPVLFLLWAVYLSLSLIGQAFLSFQWDTLLLEAGFTAMFLAPVSLWPGLNRPQQPARSALIFHRWLLFKLMFLSGITKLLSGDTTWRDLTALDFHYFTQPLPTWTSWYAHHLPGWFQQASILGMYAVELAVPFLIFFGRVPRRIAFTCLVLFQGSIAATGNYGFFNLLTAVLCVPLLDDRCLCALTKLFRRRRLATRVAQLRRLPTRHGALPALQTLAILSLLLISGLTFLREAVRSRNGEHLPLLVADSLTAADRFILAWAQPGVLDFTDRFRTINGYGLFRVMTTKRREIVIEGSRHGIGWTPYIFRWKPADPTAPPRFVAPHQPRLDWQMWFASLNPQGNAYWLGQLAQRLMEDSPQTLGLLAENPFPDKPPRYIRFVFYDYEFSNPQPATDPGAWWQRHRLGILFGPISLSDR